jgi:hypothetical protein
MRARPVSNASRYTYELAFMWLGEDYLHDDMATRLREAIMGRADIQTTRSERCEGSEHAAFQPWTDDKNAHIAYTTVHENDVIVRVRIFDVLSAAIVVSEAKSRYIKGSFDPARIRFVHIDPVLKLQRESSLMAECGRIALGKLTPIAPVNTPP